ncbi:hypothetical protein H6785_02305 [Candidatus Nomurabacteria bacterium]|nr:hypothetical protein [Candidatus Kaiserbacteria bacterium]MCB9815381.1 hypothetical protein [Candidatus Nomurabacteria bacterium]
MEPVTYVASTTAADASVVPSFGFDIFAVIGGMFGGAGSLSGGGILGFFSSLWTVFVVLSYLVTIILVVLYVFASVRRSLYSDLITQELRDAEQLYDEQFRGNARNSRLQDVITHSTSDNPNDWRLAIIEADIILDDILKKRGYVGNSLGERLKGISSNQLATINDAWEAHIVRNKIAHQGADFVLTKRIVEETIARYKRVFNEFGVS